MSVLLLPDDNEALAAMVQDSLLELAAANKRAEAAKAQADAMRADLDILCGLLESVLDGMTLQELAARGDAVDAVRERWGLGEGVQCRERQGQGVGHHVGKEPKGQHLPRFQGGISGFRIQFQIHLGGFGYRLKRGPHRADAVTVDSQGDVGVGMLEGAADEIAAAGFLRTAAEQKFDPAGGGT